MRPFSSWMSAATTRAPSETRSSRVPRPMPETPPVMTATLPSRRPGMCFLPIGQFLHDGSLQPPRTPRPPRGPASGEAALIRPSAFGAGKALSTPPLGVLGGLGGPIWRRQRPRLTSVHRHHDLAHGLAAGEMGDGVGGLGQREALGDVGFDLALFVELEELGDAGAVLGRITADPAAPEDAHDVA